MHLYDDNFAGDCTCNLLLITQVPDTHIMLPRQHFSCKSTGNAGEVGLHKDARPYPRPCCEGSRKLERHPAAFSSTVVAILIDALCAAYCCCWFACGLLAPCVGVMRDG